MRFHSAKILQIMPLPQGWWIDRENRCPGAALVEMEVWYSDDDDMTTIRAILPLHEDLTVEFPLGIIDGDDGGPVPYYLANGFGDDSTFIKFRDPEEAEASW